MDFEKEMQKALKIIFQNIQALEDNRAQLPNKCRNDLVSGCNRRQRVQKRRSSTNSKTQTSSESDASCGSARSVSNPRKKLSL